MKVGIFGGAFDPLHDEHIKIIKAAFKQLNLDKLVVVPAFNPPHKNSIMTGFGLRLEMLEIEFKDSLNIVCDNIEESLGLEKNYTYITLDFLKSFYGDNLFYIIGGDNMLGFRNWKLPQIISKQAQLVVASRKGYPNLEEAILFAEIEFGARVTLLKGDFNDTSSSYIKGLLEFRDTRAKAYMPEEIYKFIIKNNLYSYHNELITKFKNNVSSEVFEHSKSAVLFALKYASKLNLLFDEVFIAALLHDCAKEEIVDVAAMKELNTNENVYHQFAGVQIAKNEYNIDNKNILSAIESHTTGKENMSDLDKLIFVADKLEHLRKYDGVDIIRSKIFENFNEGFKYLLRENLNYLKKTNLNIDKRTLQTYLWYE